jgi:hypothetical protein
MNTNRISHALLALSLFTLAACGTGSSPAPRQVAMARPTTDTPVGGRTPAVGQKRIADEVLHDPAQRFALMERVRTQVVSETRQVPEARWLGEVRPALRRQLEQAGLARGDVDFLLWEIDQAKNTATR